MALHPDVQNRAREEIDRVLGGNMVTHEDRPSLPYVNAMIKEIMRWGPVAPLGQPHHMKRKMVAETPFFRNLASGDRG